MDLTWTQQWLIWAEAHPLLLVGGVFILLFIEGFAVIGLAVPGLMMVFMLGALVGLGRLDLWLAWTAASAGAIAGDAFNYWLGYHYRDRLAQRWPLNRYPEMHRRGQVFFHKYGALSIPLGRYIGPLRSFVPVIAGMLGMRPKVFTPMVVLTGLIWVPSFMLPGMLFGASLDLAAAYATRLSLLLGAIVAIIWLLTWGVRASYAASRRSTPWMLKRLVKWLRKHPRAGRYFNPLFNPGRGEMLSIAMLGLVLLTTLTLLITAITTLLIGDGGTSLDLRFWARLLDWRNTITDRLWITLATASAWPVLAIMGILMAIWLLWYRQAMACLHWILAVAVPPILALLLQQCLKLFPNWPEHLQSTGVFPDIQITLLMALAAGLPMLLVRELPAQRRKWFYLATTAVVGLFVMARLALGLTYLSAAWAAIILTVLWVSLVGIGYRVRVQRGWPVLQHSLFFGAAFILVAGFYTQRFWLDNQLSWEPKLTGGLISMQNWQRDGWEQLPTHRSELTKHQRERFNLQYIGDTGLLLEPLQQKGWKMHTQRSGSWWQMLSPQPQPEQLPLFRQDYQGHTAEFLLSRANGDSMQVIRLWKSGWSVVNDAQQQPIWLGRISQEKIGQRGYWFSVWQPLEDAKTALMDVQNDAPNIGWRQTSSDVLLAYSQ